MTHSPESDPVLQKIVVEVPSRSIGELTELLGDFASRHGGIMIAEALEINENKSPELAFKPEFVAWDEDSDGNRIPLITSELLKEFAKTKETSAGLANRTAAALFDDRYEMNIGELQHYGYIASGNQYGRGLNAEKLPELVGKMRNGLMPLSRIGPTSVELLADYGEEMLDRSSVQTEE